MLPTQIMQCFGIFAVYTLWIAITCAFVATEVAGKKHVSGALDVAQFSIAVVGGAAGTIATMFSPLAIEIAMWILVVHVAFFIVVAIPEAFK